MRVITTVPKNGSIQSYIDKPVVNRTDMQRRAIGVIKDAREYQDRYVLTLEIWDRFIGISSEFVDDELSTIGLQVK